MHFDDRNIRLLLKEDVPKTIDHAKYICKNMDIFQYSRDHSSRQRDCAFGEEQHTRFFRLLCREIERVFNMSDVDSWRSGTELCLKAKKQLKHKRTIVTHQDHRVRNFSISTEAHEQFDQTFSRQSSLHILNSANSKKRHMQIQPKRVGRCASTYMTRPASRTDCTASSKA